MFAALFLGASRWLESRPIQWAAYYPNALSQHAGDDRPIVIFVGAEWDANSTMVKKITFEDRALKRSFRMRSVASYYADMTYSSPEVKSLPKELHCHSTPAVAVYPSGTSVAPFIFEGMVSAEQILQALQ